jgi:hypothetical protein
MNYEYFTLAIGQTIYYFLGENISEGKVIDFDGVENTVRVFDYYKGFELVIDAEEILEY